MTQANNQPAQPETQSETQTKAKDTYTSDNNGDGKPDVIPPMVRTVAYYLGLVISAVSLVILCIVQAVGAPSWVIPVTLAVDAGYGVIAHGLGAAYNPVKQQDASK